MLSFKITNITIQITRLEKLRTTHAHAGSAIIIMDNIKHYLMESYCTEKIQATYIALEVRNEIAFSAICILSTRHKWSKAEFSNYFLKLGSRFSNGGDWTSKHTQWGSRLIDTKGRQLYKTLKNKNLEKCPIQWPVDPNKIPYLTFLSLKK